MKNKMIFRKVIILIFILCIILCFIFLEIKLFQNYRDKLNYHYLAKYMNTESPLPSSPSSDSPASTKETEKMLKLKELHSKNKDIIAWLEIKRN